MCRPPFSTPLGAINVPATRSASTTKRPTYRPPDPAATQTANVTAVRSGSTANGQRTGRRIRLHPKRPTYRPFPGAGLGNLARVGRKRRPAGFLAKRTPERPKDGRLVPPLMWTATCGSDKPLVGSLVWGSEVVATALRRALRQSGLLYHLRE